MSCRIFKFSDCFKTLYSNFCYQSVSSSHLAAAYDPVIEASIRSSQQKTFDASNPNQLPIFSMILPPPNITGNLHLGHALTITVQDVIARWRLMKSEHVCWVPGFDHAGVATQAIVERTLHARLGLTRQQIGKEKFLEEMWSWKRGKAQRTVEQINSLWPVLDWTREMFTLDKAQKESVTSALFCLWDAGLIYRNLSLVNWCCHLGSVLSDIEVNNVSISGPTSLYLPGHSRPVTFGRIVRFAYPVQGRDEEIVVATTRPETILGDVAVAVHPSDQRYSHLHDLLLSHPFTGEPIPIVLDEEVDPNFGTGALKITPFHDNLDYNISKRHDLPTKQVIQEDGLLSSICGVYAGMDRWHGREIIINDLAKKGLLRGIDSHNMELRICSRSGDVMELMLRPQWFIKCKEMAEKASNSVREGRLCIEPEKYCNIWFNWMENIRDWCISRQVWWGHELPFYHCSCGNDDSWVYARDQEEAVTKAVKLFQSKDVLVKKDDDVLDTWFSSALLPFSAFGWPKLTPDIKTHYPLSVMVTGNDILFFWVARMVMLGLQLTAQLPFKKVLLHGIICDHQGRKMSKSKGNVIDPLDIIHGTTLENLKKQVINYHKNGLINKEEVQRALEGIGDMFPKGIPTCGTDALRFTLLSKKITNTYINFDLKECFANKLFCNKLWQATKFTLYWTNKLAPELEDDIPKLISNGLHMDKWILSRLSEMVNTVNSSLEVFDFHLATGSLKSFLYSDLCNIYVEYTKPWLKSNNEDKAKNCCEILLYCLEISFRCLAPFMPHICEHLYSRLPNRTQDSILNSKLPPGLQFYDKELNSNVEEVLSVIAAIRRMKAESGIPYTKPALVYIVTNQVDKFEEFKQAIEVLSKCNKVIISSATIAIETEQYTKEFINSDIQILLKTNEGVNTSLEAIVPKKLKLKKQLDKLQKIISGQGYKRASPEIRRDHSEKLLQITEKLKQLDHLEGIVLKSRRKND